jgi:glycine oxidase
MPAQEGGMSQRQHKNPASPGACVNVGHTAAALNDLIVVGAGVIGLSIAWRAAQRGLCPLVLDAGEPGDGATGVAAGMLAPVTEADFGEEALLELNLASARMYPAFVSELEAASGIAAGYRETGALNVAVDRDQAEELARLHELQRSLGLEARWLTPRECRALEPGLAPRVAGGIDASGDHQVSPRLLGTALRAALELAGGSVRSHTPVESIAVEGGEAAGVVLASGEELRARTVVIAAGARSAGIVVPPGADVPVRPVKGQILRLAGDPEQPVCGRIVRTTEVYAVPRADGRLIVGATVEERGFDAAVTAGGVLDLLRAGYEVLPGIAELQLLQATAGHRPATPDNQPVIGESAVRGLVWATGHWRNGVLLAPVTADAVASLAVEGTLPDELSRFSPRRFAAAQVVR